VIIEIQIEKDRSYSPVVCRNLVVIKQYEIFFNSIHFMKPILRPNLLANSMVLLIVLLVISACSKEVTKVDKAFIVCDSTLVLEQIAPLPSSYEFFPNYGPDIVEFRNIEDDTKIDYLITGQGAGERNSGVTCFVPCPEAGQGSMRVEHSYAYKSLQLQSLNQSDLDFPMHQISIRIQAVEKYGASFAEGVADMLIIRTYDEESENHRNVTEQMRKVIDPRNYPEASSKEVFTFHETLELDGVFGYSNVYESVNETTGLRIYYHMIAGVVVIVEENGTTWERVYND